MTHLQLAPAPHRLPKAPDAKTVFAEPGRGENGPVPTSFQPRLWMESFLGALLTWMMGVQGVRGSRCAKLLRCIPSRHPSASPGLCLGPAGLHPACFIASRLPPRSWQSPKERRPPPPTSAHLPARPSSSLCLNHRQAVRFPPWASRQQPGSPRLLTAGGCVGPSGSGRVWPNLAGSQVPGSCPLSVRCPWKGLEQSRPLGGACLSSAEAPSCPQHLAGRG